MTAHKVALAIHVLFMTGAITLAALDHTMAAFLTIGMVLISYWVITEIIRADHEDKRKDPP